MGGDKKILTARLLCIAAVVLFLVDRFLKSVALDAAAAPTGAFSFALFKNTGIIFSVPIPDPIFWPFAIVIFALLWLAFFTSVWREPLPASMIFFLNAGATSNLIDRFLYGATIDYFIFFNRSAVNIADAMIIAGVLMLYFHHRKGEAA